MILSVCLTNLRRSDHIGFAVILVADVSLLVKGKNGLILCKVHEFHDSKCFISKVPTYSLQLHMLVSTGIHLTT